MPSQQQHATVARKRRRKRYGSGRSRRRSEQPWTAAAVTAAAAFLALVCIQNRSVVPVLGVAADSVERPASEQESKLRKSQPVQTIRRRNERQPAHQRLLNDTSHDDPSQEARRHRDFLDWCQKSLGIVVSPSVQIQTFRYYDYIKAMAEGTDVFCHEDDDVDDGDDNNNDDTVGGLEDVLSADDTPADDDNGSSFFWNANGRSDKNNDDQVDDDLEQFYPRPSCAISVTEYPTVPVRGLAARHDIEPNDTLLQIPYKALWTVENIIDHDPVLSKALGPSVRQKHGWNDGFYELALLSVALLHHLQFDVHSPYLDLFASPSSTLHDTIPVLWDAHRLRTQTTDGVRKITKRIQRDIRDMYKAVVQVLQLSYPKLFSTETFSFPNFKWAFTVVNSRHWHLSIPPTQEDATNRAEHAHHGTDSTLPDGDSIIDAPPASVPTDEWVAKQERGETETSAEPLVDRPEPYEYHDISRSFLAPVADLINFGPPCTRGIYNTENQSFDIVATCPFRPGQEITFWYSNACQDVIIANYGFAFPTMIPECRDEHRDLVRKNHELQRELYNLFEELDSMAIHLETLQQTLDQCCRKEEGVPRIPPSFPPWKKALSLFTTAASDHNGINGDRQTDGMRDRLKRSQERRRRRGGASDEDRSSL